MHVGAASYVITGVISSLSACLLSSILFAPSNRHILALGSPANDNGTPQPRLLATLKETLAVANQNPTALIFVTGSAVKTKMVEANAMKDWLRPDKLYAPTYHFHEKPVPMDATRMFHSRMVTSEHVDWDHNLIFPAGDVQKLPQYESRDAIKNAAAEAFDIKRDHGSFFRTCRAEEALANAHFVVVKKINDSYTENHDFLLS